MVNQDFFESLCDSFEESLHTAEREELLPDGGHSVALGNETWYVEIFCKDDSIEDPRFPLLQLVRTRRDLMYNLLSATNFKEYIYSAHHLAEWLDHRGYAIALGGHTWWGRFRIWSFNQMANVMMLLNRG
jgi:hypothetical protein